MSNTKSAGGRPSKARVAEINQNIILATLRAYADHGGELNVQDVAQAAGVSKQAIYRRWPSKLELIIDAVETGMDMFLSYFADDLPASPIEALKVLARRLYDGDRVFATRFALSMDAHGAVEPQLRERFDDWERRSIAPIVAAVESLHMACGLPDHSVAEKAQLIIDLFNGAGLRVSLKRSTSDEERGRVFDTTWEYARRMLLA